MTVDDMKSTMNTLWAEKLPDEQTLEEWSAATGMPVAEVKRIYGEVINDPDPWGPLVPVKDDGQ